MPRDFFDPLVEELLGEVAESFFEARRQLDAKIDIFHSYVSRLAQKGRFVQERAAILNFLLLDERRADAFYRLLSIDADLFAGVEKFDSHNLPERLPFGLTRRRRYSKLVLEAYRRLQRVCRDYRFGQREAVGAETPEIEAVSYTLVVDMAKILNQEIDKINCSLSPSCRLQFAKKFHPEMQQKEKIAGTGDLSYNAIEKQLLYSPIDLQSLNIIQYPTLPDVRRVKPEIESFCKTVYDQNPEAVKRRMEELQRRIRSAAA